MTIKQLEEGTYYQSEYDDMILFAESFNPGAKIFKVDKETKEVEACEIVFIIQRSKNPEWYDKHNYEDYSTSISNVDYYFSGEFILMGDYYYVFAG